MFTNKAQKTFQLKQKALSLGFSSVGIAKPQFMEPESIKLEAWLSKGYNGEMASLADHFEKRVDPTKLIPGAKSMVMLTYNYFPDEDSLSTSEYKISRYSYGRDYHKVVRKKLKILWAWMIQEFGAVEGRYFVDSAPVLERDWAKRAGLGWVGKHSLLIDPKQGSYFFLGEMVIDLELDYDEPIKDYCGTCKKCIEACPTQAISPEGYFMDGSKCISYLTIEIKKAIPEAFQSQMQDWMYGCDICQEVCPWNRFAKPHNEPQFQPSDGLLSMHPQDWLNLTDVQYDELFEGSAVKRAGFSGLKRNINFLNSK